MVGVTPPQPQSHRSTTPPLLDSSIHAPPANAAGPGDESKSSDLSPRECVKRVVEKTVDRLGRSLSGRSSLKKSTHPKRVLSIGRTTRILPSSADAADG